MDEETQKQWREWLNLCLFVQLVPIAGWRVLSKAELYKRLGLRR